MSVRRGEDWGEPGELPAGAPVVSSDRDLAELAAGPDAPEVIGLVGGDLHRTLGGPHRTAEDLRRDGGTLLLIDLGEARLHRRDDTVDRVAFAAHVVARTSRGPLLFGHTFIAMNSAFVGPDNLGPRAHPGDGALDLLEGRLRGWDWLRSRRRRRSGTHVPHPGLHQQRSRQVSRDLAKGARVEVDGVDAGIVIGIDVGVLPGAAKILI